MKQAFFHALSLRGQIVRREGKGQRMVKMFYLCKLVTVFGRGYGNLSHLFRVPYVAPGDRFEATARPSGSRETMRHTPFRRPPPLVASINQRRLAHFTQFHQHNLSRIIWVRAAPAPCARGRVLPRSSSEHERTYPIRAERNQRAAPPACSRA